MKNTYTPRGLPVAYTLLAVVALVHIVGLINALVATYL
jgi:hypothetical protein